jgi:Kef-type K+ transport system membrane component KefB
MVALVPRLVRKLTTQRATEPATLVAVLVGVLMSAGMTEWIGLHFIFGAFLLGVVVAREAAEALRDEIIRRVGHLAMLLLPVYFVVAGFQVNLSGLNAPDLTELGLIMLVAMGGKFAGVYTAGRFSRMDGRSCAALATLMNTRGLTELVLLTIGLQVGILDNRLYSLMVAMTVITTVVTGPLLRLVHPISRVERELTESGPC